MENALDVAALAVSTASLLFDTLGHANEWPRSFRRVVSWLAVLCAGGVLVVSALNAIPGHRLDPWERGAAALVALPLLLIGVRRLRRIPRTIVDHDVLQMIKAAGDLVEDAGTDASEPGVDVDATSRIGRKERRIRLSRLLRARWRGAGQLTLVRGPAGAGKTYGLRGLARRGMPRGRRPAQGRVIPVYVDLRFFVTDAGPVEANSYREFLAGLLGRGDSFLRGKVLQYFREHREVVGWLFLFDSFDEIPALLDSTDVARTAEEHLTAIRRLVDSLPNSHAVIASRDFAEPSAITSSRLITINPLSPKNQRSLMKALIPQRQPRRTLSKRLSADPGLRRLAENPLTLRLICGYIRDTDSAALDGGVFGVTHQAVHARVVRILGGREPVAAGVVRVAQQLAFCLTLLDAPTGWNWARVDAEMAKREFASGPELHAAVQTLEQARLLRTVPDTGGAGPLKAFTFAHRSIQELLAAGLLLAEPGLLAPGEMLAGHRWEGVVPLLLRNGTAGQRAAILTAAERMLAETLAGMTGLPEIVRFGDPARMTARRVARFEWPPASVPLVRMLAAGQPRQAELPGSLGDTVGRLVIGAFVAGTAYDRSLALDVLALVPDWLAQWAIGRTLVRETITVLRRKALDQVVRLDLPPFPDETVHFLLINQILDLERNWSVGAADGLPSWLGGLRLISEVTAAVFGLYAIGWFLSGFAGLGVIFAVLFVVALLWAGAVHGSPMPPTVAPLVGYLLLLTASIVFCVAVGEATTTVAAWLFLAPRSAVRHLGHLVLALLPLWPIVAAVVHIAGTPADTALLRMRRPLGALLRRRLDSVQLSGSRAAAFGIASLVLVVAAVVGDQREAGVLRLSGAAEHSARVAVIVVLLSLAAVAFAYGLAGDWLHDQRWLTRWRGRPARKVDDADLLGALTEIRTGWGLRRLFEDLDDRARRDPAVLVPMGATLVNLDHALDHLTRIMPSGVRWRVPPTIWENEPPFGDDRFVDWLRLPGTSRTKLRWLAGSSRERVMELRERVQTGTIT
ncbi:hypothetical protein ACTOB_006677 [Actinoplanes oblitus]|uniref:NACHT domain-containing protein n=1 Tax=Actinoplanes oblitus TaxID=3040509 RepID=A0ABY8WBY5_9ACTN|nr:NACHT domain-containing protein [Actinoplanes oblitus]WIM94636.1 hypothetical protein ACTOB_006677 [Actinoplanes oblitus]